MYQRIIKWVLMICLGVTTESIFAAESPKALVGSQTCSQLAQALIDGQIISTDQVDVNELLDFAAQACGLKLENTTPIQNPKPILVRFPHSQLSILWDGYALSLNEQAEASLNLVLPPSFSNIMVVPQKEITTEFARITQQSDETSGECKGFVNCLMKKISHQADNLHNIYNDGETYLIVAGYAWHDRSPYTKAQQARLNEKTYGIGIEKVLINKNGNREGVSFLVFKDSMSNPQYNVAYEIQKRLLQQGSVAVYAGVTMGVLARKQFDYKPLPFMFPSATISVGKVNLKTIILPKMGRTVNPGTVVFLFGSVAL